MKWQQLKYSAESDRGKYSVRRQLSLKHWLQLPVAMLYNHGRRVTMEWNSSDAICHNRDAETKEPANNTPMSMPFWPYGLPRSRR